MKAVVFDLDGTLLDTLQGLTDSVNAALAEQKLPLRTLDEVREFVGNGVRRLIEQAVPQGTGLALTDAVHAAFLRDYAVHAADKTTVYPGVLALMRELKSRGLRVAVFSNKIDSAVRALCRDFFGGLPDIARGELPSVPRKPSPEGLWRILDEWQIGCADALYIGDSEVDFALAGNAGVAFCGVAWGFRGGDYLRALGASWVAETPGDILLRLQGSETVTF